MKKLSKRSRGLILFGIALGCFALLGFVSQITAPLTQNFDKALFIDSLHSVDLRPNLYAILTVMTLPAALLARYFGIRACLLMGMCLFSGGALSTLPAAQVGTAGPLAIGITFIYSGLAFIDTAAMTMMVTYGERQKSYGRILVGKTFEMAGWAVGLCATTFIFSPRSITPEMGSGTLSESLFAEAAQRADLMTAATPFIWVGAVACVMVFISALQEANDSTPDPALKYKLVGIAKKLSKDKTYLFGAAALAVYLMTQVFCWHNIVGLSTAAEMSEAGDTPPHKASGHATDMILLTLLFFCIVRLIVIPYAYRKKNNPRKLLLWVCCAASALTLASAFAPCNVGKWLVVLATTAMSLIFPTIVELMTRHLDRETAVVAMPLAVMSNFGGLLAWLVNKLVDPDSPLIMVISAVTLAGIAAYAVWLDKNKPKPARNSDFYKTPTSDD